MGDLVRDLVVEHRIKVTFRFVINDDAEKRSDAAVKNAMHRLPSKAFFRNACSEELIHWIQMLQTSPGWQVAADPLTPTNAVKGQWIHTFFLKSLREDLEKNHLSFTAVLDSDILNQVIESIQRIMTCTHFPSSATEPNKNIDKSQGLS
jgi:hypothetical protein